MRPPPVTASLLVKVLWIQTVVLQCVLSVEVAVVREASACCKEEQVPVVREKGAYWKGEQLPIVREKGAHCEGEQAPTVREVVTYYCMGLYSL